MSELEASRAARHNESSSSASSSSSSSCAAAAASLAAAASVSATTAAFSSHLSRCVEATRALAAVRRAAPAAYAVLSQVMTAKAAAPPPIDKGPVKKSKFRPSKPFPNFYARQEAMSERRNMSFEERLAAMQGTSE